MARSSPTDPSPTPTGNSSSSSSSASNSSSDPPASPRGTFIVFEGIDRSGKSSQTAALCSRLTTAGVPVVLKRFPDRTTSTGKMISAYLENTAQTKAERIRNGAASDAAADATAEETELSDQAIHVLFSTNRWEAQTAIKRLLRQGTTVIADRYAYSGVAYTAAKFTTSATNPTTSTEDSQPPPTATNFYNTLSWCKNADRGLLTPDVVVFMDIDPAVAAARAEYGNERYEKIEFQRGVASIFEVLGEEEGVGRWKKVDAARSAEEVKEGVWGVVEPVMQRVAAERRGCREDLWLD
ncbi:P-loop containing nucleoside triphosphate hydrolase protein [Fimicolochytrium jonesii]|uniref:P-loop containing nucleoside triphosphate hydrolase protein n=1 Tax=Fimicolochytrium jonesii TaxID=1396493 RepID=UPI0022FE421C|nr:P-loop containing nucleoside triphosphate hydrolase protein [Fimicolochytrium jonesii]KAI8821342.1 P-loop containing nucleoside triphosphate hydrolase protein [Fimicolochytrium jonesii]